MSEPRKSKTPPPKKKKKSLSIPRRAPSVIIPPREMIFPSADRNTCIECPCYPKESPYRKPPKLRQCQVSPQTLYELAEVVVNKMILPPAFRWDEDDVVRFISEDCGLPQYKECILDNRIDGMRMLMLEDPSKLPMINIHDFKHILIITKKIRELFGTDFILFVRSIGLPPRYPLTHCTWFKSRTGPSWGIRRNWSNCDVLRWMKILLPEPIYRDHWDLIWYLKPDFPKLMFARVPKPPSQVHIPQYVSVPKEPCLEYLAPRRFRLQVDIPEEFQVIWMEHRRMPKKKEKKIKVIEKSRLEPKKITLTGLAGKDLILARRKMNKPKFLVMHTVTNDKKK